MKIKLMLETQEDQSTLLYSKMDLILKKKLKESVMLSQVRDMRFLSSLRFLQIFKKLETQ